MNGQRKVVAPKPAAVVAQMRKPNGSAFLLLLLLCSLTLGLSYTPAAHLTSSVQRSAIACRGQPVAMGKGFGKPSKAPRPSGKPAPRPPTEASARRDKAAADFDQLKASGAPEYLVHVRTAPEDGPVSKWYPVGGIAVPRSSSEDQALALAIFNNEEDLLKGAFRSYPFLKKSTDKFEYGYRLKEFPDDPVKLATKDNVDKANNPIQQWINALDNPLNDGSGWFNPP